jgi:hypothetical protein
MAREMVKESFIFKMEASLRDHGRTIRCMERVVYTIPIVNWPMKADGTWIVFMEGEKFTMTLLNNWSFSSTTII